MESDTEEESYRESLSLFYPVFFLIALLVQTFMLFMIIRYTPKSMAILKTILANTSFSQLILLIICYSCQFRMISNEIPVQLLSYGPARFLRPWIVYSLQHLFQFFLFMSGMSIMVTFYFKYAQVFDKRLSTMKMFGIFGLFHIPVGISAILEIIMIITQALPQQIQDKYDLINQNITVYATIGVLSLQTIPSQINFFLMVGSVFSYPFVGFFFRARILRLINSVTVQTSKSRKVLYRSFITGLTIQALLPLICYTPVFTLYVWCVLTKTKILFQQYFMYLLPVFTALIDPIVSLYFMTPYRNRILKWIGVKRIAQGGPTTVSVVMA